MPQPATQSSYISQMIESLHPAPQATPFLERRIRQEIDKLGKANRLAADLAICDLESALGNRSALWQAILTLERDGFPQYAGHAKIMYYAIELKASEARKFLPYAAPNRPHPLSHSLPVLESLGAFKSITEFMREAKENNILLPGLHAFERAQSAVQLMDELGITDDIITKTIDQAGMLLEEKKIDRRDSTFSYTMPVDHPIPDPFIHMRYELPVSFEMAAQLNQELAERIILADLFVSPGFTISFQGKG